MTTYPRPLHLPPLPVPPHSQNWAANINQAYTILSDAYDAASQLLRLEDGDPIRFRLHADRLVNRMAPILHELVPLTEDEEWATIVFAAFDSLVNELKAAAEDTGR